MKRLSNLSPYDIACKVGCHYSGDVNLVDHGGTFYSLKDIDRDYIPCVRFYGERVDGLSFFEVGSIPLLNLDTLFSALRCIGVEMDGEGLHINGMAIDDASLPHVVVDALLAYGCAEWDETTWYATYSDYRDDPRILDDERFPIVIGGHPSTRLPRERAPTENQVLHRALRSAGLMS